MKCIETHEDGLTYRIFKGRTLGIFPYYILEDCREATERGGVWFDVKINKFYFKTLKQVKKYYDTVC